MAYINKDDSLSSLLGQIGSRPRLPKNWVFSKRRRKNRLHNFRNLSNVL